MRRWEREREECGRKEGKEARGGEGWMKRGESQHAHMLRIKYSNK